MKLTDSLLLAGGVLGLSLTMVLAAADTALGRVPKNRAQTLLDEERRNAGVLLKLVSQPESYVTVLRLALLIFQLFQVACVSLLGLRLMGLPEAAFVAAADIVAMVVLAEAAPRTWAAHRSERLALALSRSVRAFTGLSLLRLTARGLVRLANVVVPGPGIPEGPYVAEQEPLAVPNLGMEEGVIEQNERQLIASILEFGDTVVREVMVPRPDMITVDISFRVADVMEVMLLNGYSRLPMCGDGIDDVVGLVYAKDLMRAERDGHEDRPVTEFRRDAIFVPETKRLPELLREMQQQQFHMAIVLDEYGGTAGLVTLEDIIEELVGEIVDEYDVEDPMIEPLPGGDVLVRGRTPLDEINDLLNADLPEGDWDTVGGLLYSRLGRVPAEDESVDIEGWTLTAQRIQGRRIGRVRISPPVAHPDPSRQ